MKKSLQLKTAFAVALSSLIINNSTADDLHYNNIIIGDRANGLGGAYTALSDDPAGVYHNPAGIVYSGNRNLSASVNAFKNSTTTYQDVFAGGKDYERSSSALLPNFFGITQPLGDGIFGFSYAVTDSILEDQDSEFFNPGPTTEYYNLNFNNTDTTYKIGLSYAYEINQELSIGMTLYAHIRNKETITNQWIRKVNGDYQINNHYDQIEETGIEPVFGIMWSPLENFSFGMAVRQINILRTSHDQQSICVSTIAVAPDPNDQCQPQHDGTSFIPGTVRDPLQFSATTNRELPLQLNLGMAYFASQSFLVSADVAHYSKTDTAEAVINLSMGAEYYVTDSWALRGGIYTDNANTPDIVSGGINQADHINLSGLSFSLSHFNRNASITAGIGMNFGSGKAQVLGNSTAIQDIDYLSTSLYISSSYKY